MRILFLDDNDYRIETFMKNVAISTDRIKTCKTSKEYIDYIKAENWDFIMLDHDYF